MFNLILRNMFLQCLCLLYFSVSLSSQVGDRFLRGMTYHTHTGKIWTRKFSSFPSDCETPTLDHGRTRSRLRGKLMKFVCYPNFVLVGNRYATCVDGQWDEPMPVCVKPGCKVPKVPNGIILPMHKEAWLSIFCIPGYVIHGSSVMYCNGRTWNASTPMCLDGAPPKMSCDFEDEDLCGWRHDELHDFDWRRQNLKTPSSFMHTGPSYDHTLGPGQSGHYMYVESTSRAVNDTARLISPIYSNKLSEDGCFSFYYHMLGSSMGGLRVYQKPENLSLSTLLEYSQDEKKPYIIFEKWNNQGDFWYQSVTALKDYGEDFQIIIEGIRGFSFVSDMAVDDVAILLGRDCMWAKKAAVTPPNFVYDSCADRCGPNKQIYHEMESECSCHETCLASGKCCSDYLELCVFNNDTSTTSNDYDYTSTPINNQSDNHPQTQRLIGTSPTTTVTTTPQPTTTPTTPATTPKPTYQTTSTKKPATTTKPTTKFTTKLATTVKATTKKTPQLVFKSTTRVYNATGVLVKDKNATKPATKTAHVTTKKPVTTVVTTTYPTTPSGYHVSRTFENHNHPDQVEAAKKRQQEKINAHKIIMTTRSEDKSSTSSLLIILAILVCISGVGCGVWGARTARGRAALARVTGRVRHDPEVRYLTNQDD